MHRISQLLLNVFVLIAVGNQLSAQNSFINGNIVRSDGVTPVQSGTVIVHFGRFSQVNSPIDSLGNFSVSDSIPDSVWVEIVPDITLIPTGISTYYRSVQNSFYQDSAQVITLLPGDSLNIGTVEILEFIPANGTDTIKGAVFSNIAGPSDPFPGVNVTLLDQSNGIIQQQITDTNGAFQFINIPNGTYQVYVNVFGFSMMGLHTIVFNNRAPQVREHIFYGVQEDGIHPLFMVDVEEHFVNDEINVYPNPVLNSTITVESTRENETNFSLYTLSGERLENRAINLHRGSNQLTLPTLIPGMYIIEVGGVKRRVLVK